MDTSQRPDLEKKLEAVAYMRQSAEESRQRLAGVGEILGGFHAGGYREGGYRTDAGYLNREGAPGAQNEYDGQNKTNLTFAGSFAFRCGLVLLILAFFWAGKNAPDGKVNALRNQCTQMIAVDYSEKLFDFIREIPYTFDYEKTDAEG